MKVIPYDEIYKKDIVKIVRNFYDESLKEYECKFDEGTLQDTIDKHYDSMYLLIIDDVCEGLIAGVPVVSPVSGGLVFQEMIWYVNKPHRKYGVYLLRYVEKDLKSKGYTAVVMACMANSKTSKLIELYEKMGYVPFELHLIRSL